MRSNKGIRPVQAAVASCADLCAGDGAVVGRFRDEVAVEVEDLDAAVLTVAHDHLVPVTAQQQPHADSNHALVRSFKAENSQEGGEQKGAEKTKANMKAQEHGHQGRDNGRQHQGGNWLAGAVGFRTGGRRCCGRAGTLRGQCQAFPRRGLGCRLP